MLQLVAGFMGFVSYAFAYIPSAEQVFSLMPHQKHQDIQVLVLMLETTFYGDEWPDGAMTVKETVCYRYPDRFLSKIHVSSVDKIYFVQGEASLITIDQKIISEEKLPMDAYKDLFLYRSPESVMYHLSKEGINTGTVSFGRLDNKIAYVIGAVYPDESLPQVWVEKDTFRPLRLFFPRSDTSAKIDIRYDHYFSIGGGMWYPGRVTFYQDDQPVKEQVLKTYKTSSDADAFPEYLFDIEKLKKIYTSVIEQGHKDETSSTSELDDVKRTIDDFQKVFE
jgi:hypothetical protein